ncbi:beta-ketoacyl-ACP synthase [Candidatus Odyssella acanthamoebae]|uniref:3-oxoacyl-ACP synthase n=1 Tax=Candidatus Odyssella acanthamoebae TaxID=91604 RepID=A0A077B0A3_9PROT|nr:beta-ketoacyl-ACP synthase [Candidatus Paracaedibacter acanthamoebae]AIK96375.1 3-oxoacyl-ACP synthase [Candidatus Paracaedibacter acanthamoebae]
MIEHNKIYLNDLGLACSLGIGKQAISDALFAPTLSFEKEANNTASEIVASGRSVVVKRVPGSLEAIKSPFQKMDTRTNRILKLVLDEIKTPINHAKSMYGSHRIGIILSTSTSGMQEGYEALTHYQQTGTWPDSYCYRQQEFHSPTDFAAEYLGIGGPAYTISTACSSSGKALCSAARLIKANICDAVIVGGVDSLCDLTLNGFESLDLIAQDLCSPFSRNRQGINIGEGAAVFLMSRQRSDIEYAGGGESSDAYHISSPAPNGEGAEAAIKAALAQANLSIDDICYINLHGTGTSTNDLCESHCISRLFGTTIPTSSTKAFIGHTLGAAGALEAGFLWLSLQQDHQATIPALPHLWDGERDPSLPPLYFTTAGERLKPKGSHYCLMSNSFAFGGSNVSLILRKEVSHD